MIPGPANDAARATHPDPLASVPTTPVGVLRLSALAATGERAQLNQTEPARPGFASGSWFGLFAPAGTPKDIVAALNAEVVKMLTAPDVRERMLQQGAEPAPNTPAQFEQLVRSDIARWAKVIQVSGTKVD